MKKKISECEAELKLAEEIAAFRNDPAGFVRYAFPWGQGLLAGETGPDQWQQSVLDELARASDEAIKSTWIAVASGHGVGKTALIAWMQLWFISTRPHPQIVVTANTKVQLETKTWRELAKWHKMAVNRHWFNWTASKFYHVEHPDTWFASAVPWSKERSEAFAGAHERDVLFLFDEASLIADEIWEVTEGAMTQPGSFWVVFGNPTRNTGRFTQCFRKFRHRWSNRQVDSRTCKMSNSAQLDQWLEDYGDDSDFVRVRIKGQFPRAASNQLIPLETVENAAGRQLPHHVYNHAPKTLGVDVARFGEDRSVIIRRQGLAVQGLRKLRNLDTMTLAGLVAREIHDYKPDAVFIDEVGIGAGVVDRLRQLGCEVVPVNAGSRAAEDRRYHNLRAEMWDSVREWLESGGVIPDDPELKDDLIGPEFFYDGADRIQLEKKEDMKKRGLASPDCADALALTFAQPVQLARDGRPGRAVTDYNVIGGADR